MNTKTSSKMSYSTPQLTVHGNVEAITQGGHGGGERDDDGGSGRPCATPTPCRTPSCPRCGCASS